MYVVRGMLFGLAIVAAMFIGFAIVGLIADWVDLTIFGLLMVVGFILLWSGALYDIWRRGDLSTGARVAWTVGIVILPIIGSVVYALIRPAAENVTYRGEQPV